VAQSGHREGAKGCPLLGDKADAPTKVHRPPFMSTRREGHHSRDSVTRHRGSPFGRLPVTPLGEFQGPLGPSQHFRAIYRPTHWALQSYAWQELLRVTPVRPAERRGLSLVEKRPETLLETEGTTLVLTRLPEGKIRVTEKGWPDGATILAGEVMEVRFRNGRIHIIKRPKLLEAEDQPPTGFERGE